MNLATVWKTGGATLEKGQRRFMAGMWVLWTLFAVALLFLRRPNVGAAALMVYAFGLVFWWAFAGGRAVLLQRDLRLLGVPGADRAILASLAFQYVLSAWLPTLLLAEVAGLDIVRTGAFLSLCVAAALMFVVLPRVLGSFFGFLPMFMQYLNMVGVMPGLSDPAFARVGWAMTAAFALVAAWRWRVLLATDPETFGTWSMPMVLQMRGQIGVQSGWKNFDSNLFFAAKNSALAGETNLGSIGPATPIRALRVWLGGIFAPMSPRMRLIYTAFTVLPLVLVALFNVAVDSHQARAALGPGIAAVAVLFPAMIAAIAPARLHRFCQSASAEISLLAVLPGVDARTAKRNLLLASLGLTLAALALLYAVFAGLALAYSAGFAVFAAVSTMLSLNILGGRTLPARGVSAFCIAAFVLASVTPGLLQTSGHDFRFATAADAVLGAWACWFALCAWFGRGGWRAYRRRPHAFLLNS